jgi:hypothetical protein
MTQGETVFHAARKRPLTYLDMLQLRAGLSPWKRLVEHMRARPDYMIRKGVRRCGGEELVTWRVVRVDPNCK